MVQIDTAVREHLQAVKTELAGGMPPRVIVCRHLMQNVSRKVYYEDVCVCKVIN